MKKQKRIKLSSTNFSLFSRRPGGRLGEEGRGDEGFGGADPATSRQHDPDRRFSQAFALIPALALTLPTLSLPASPPTAGRERA